MLDAKDIHNEAVDATCYLADFIMVLELKREQASYLKQDELVDRYSAELVNLRAALSTILKEF